MAIDADESRPTQPRPSLADMSPAYFGLAMATGIVSLAASMTGRGAVATALFYLNLAHYAALWVLYGLRAWRHPRRFFGDMATHARGPGYFTMVAATGILANQFMVLAGNFVVGMALWLLAILLWLALNYTVFAALTLRHDKPHLDKGIGGAWLLAVVATQSLAVNGALLVSRVDPAYRLQLNLLAMSMWLLGGMFYAMIMSLIFYRYMFFPITAGDLAPPYWINMGAMAISTLAGSLLILNARHAPFLTSVLPFLKGVTLLYWATGTWWIPLLLALGVWRYAFQGFPFRYDPGYWAAVFPLGMYSACTWQMCRAMEFDFLVPLPRAFFYVALAAWTVTYGGMLHSLARDLRPRRV